MSRAELERRIAEERMHELEPHGERPNTTGRLPPEARGKRVAVVLRSGAVITEPVNKDTPPGWAADGKNGCRWTHHDDVDSPAAQFDIIGYKVL